MRWLVTGATGFLGAEVARPRAYACCARLTVIARPMDGTLLWMT
jgi:thioester reductase-like protein